MVAEVEYKEVGRNHYSKTSYNGENLTRKYIIDFFGLNKPDVESYKITIH